MPMQSVVFDCEVLTPMFLAGENQHAQPEFRAPSVRGELRYWLRAMLGGAGITDSEQLFQWESKVFGNTDTTSPVTVRIINRQVHPVRRAENLIPRNAPSGIKYLYYSTKLGPNNRPYFEPGTPFRVILSTIRCNREAPAALEMAGCAFWLVAHLGGLGTRSRRTAGSFSATVKKTDIWTPSFDATAAYTEYISKQIQEIIAKTTAFVALPGRVTQRPSFDILHPEFCTIWLSNRPHNTWRDAVNTIGRDFQRFRLRRGSPENPTPSGMDYQTVKRFIESHEREVPETVERASFGLPLTFRYSSLRGSKTNITPEHFNRRASPLWVQVVKQADNRYDSVLTFFQSQFLPHGKDRIKIGGKTISAPADRLVPDFVITKLPHAHRVFP